MSQFEAECWGVPGVSKDVEVDTELRKIRIRRERTPVDRLHVCVGAAEGLRLGVSVGINVGVAVGSGVGILVGIDDGL
jgi:hypothetical protein